MIVAAVMSCNNIVLVRLSLFALDHLARVPCQDSLLYGLHEANDTLTLSTAITMNSSDGRNVLFPQFIYFKWPAKMWPVCFLSSVIPLAFFSHSNGTEWLLVRIKLLILFSSAHLIVFSLYCLFRDFWHSHFLRGACIYVCFSLRRSNMHQRQVINHFYLVLFV